MQRPISLVWRESGRRSRPNQLVRRRVPGRAVDFRGSTGVPFDPSSQGVVPPSASATGPVHEMASATGYQMVSILLAEDHPVVRNNLVRLLDREADFHMVGDASDGLTALGMAQKLRPDVLITDLVMPGLHGIELVRRLKLESSGTRVVIVSNHVDEPYVRESFRVGASAYVCKDYVATHLVAAVRAVLAGRRYVSPPVQDSGLA